MGDGDGEVGGDVGGGGDRSRCARPGRGRRWRRVGHGEDPARFDQVGVVECGTVGLLAVVVGRVDLAVAGRRSEMLGGDLGQGVAGGNDDLGAVRGAWSRFLAAAVGWQGVVRKEQGPADVQHGGLGEVGAVGLDAVAVEGVDLLPAPRVAEGLLRDPPQRVPLLHHIRPCPRDRPRRA